MSLAGSCILAHLKFLRCTGFCRLPRWPPGLPLGQSSAWPGDRVSLRRRAHDYYCMVILSIVTFHNVQHFIKAYKEWGDLERLSRVLFPLLCYLNFLMKLISCLFGSEHLDTIIHGLDDASFNQHGPGPKQLLQQTAVRAQWFLRMFVGSALGTSALWGAFPVAQWLRGEAAEIPFWTIDCDNPYLFAAVLGQSLYISLVVAAGTSTMDALVGTVLYQCSTQLRILRMNFESLPERSKEVLKETTKETHETILNRLLVECILHFNKISDIMKQLLEMFGVALLLQFMVGATMLCTATFTSLAVDKMSIEFASTSSFVVCVAVELFIYCYVGNEVTIESERIAESVYNMEWVDQTPRFQKALVLVMERAKRPLRPAALGFIPLSLDTFVTIIKSTYSLLSVLQQVK